MIAMVVTRDAPSSQSTHDTPERSRTCLTASTVFTARSPFHESASVGQLLDLGTAEPRRVELQVRLRRAPRLIGVPAAIERNDSQIRRILGARIARVFHEETREGRRCLAIRANVEHGGGGPKISPGLHRLRRFNRSSRRGATL